jgi:MFS superfamily sulfate permease-like transporter/CRP-like cAMP-binding protein
VLKALPAIVVALLIGLTIGMNTGLNTGMAVPTPPSPAYFDFSWVSLRLWPALRQEPLGHLLVVGLPGTITLALVMVLESFTANHVMEMRFGLRIDANRQLVVLGGSNIVSAILGGVPCTSSTVRCVANWNAGGRGPASALASLTITGGLMLAFGSLLMALPAGVVAGLFLLQAPLMADPTFTSRLAEMLRTRRLHREGAGDLGFWITFVISLTGFLGGLIWASFMGIGLSALAVLRRVSSNLTARWGYLNQYHSRRVRSAGEARNLERAPHRVGVLQLTGHLFFGNSTRLTQMVEELHEDATAALIDVSHVHDVDPSGLNALNYVVRALLDRSLTVVLTGLQRTASIELKTALGNLQGVQYRVDLDHGLELCEEFVLQNSTVVAISPQTIPLVSNQLLQDLDASEIDTVLRLGARRETPKGSALFYRDDAADGVWLLEAGTVSILTGTADGAATTRLATFGPGQFVGEMGYIDGKSRSATAKADTTVVALLLDKTAIAELVQHQPAIALKITRNIARELSHRVRSTSAMLTEETAETPSEWSNSYLGGLSRA